MYSLGALGHSWKPLGSQDSSLKARAVSQSNLQQAESTLQVDFCMWVVRVLLLASADFSGNCLDCEWSSGVAELHLPLCEDAEEPSGLRHQVHIASGKDFFSLYFSWLPFYVWDSVEAISAQSSGRCPTLLHYALGFIGWSLCSSGVQDTISFFGTFRAQLRRSDSTAALWVAL